MLFAPEASQHVDETMIHHVWSCESCGYLFETSVRLTAQMERQPVAA
jgi:rubrerythrin